ncbi:MAG: VWA domain-containing protein [Anaerolineae bacterium]|nr:VWA domain-containing protein [Anaerolineae bacterium]
MKADFALDYDVLTVEQPHKLYLMARLNSGPAPDNQRRRPLNLSLVIDRSGSMGGEKIVFTRQSAQFLVQNLGAHDLLSVVLYNENVETLLPPENVIHKDAINQRINQIKASGMTNLSGGWLQGCGLVAENIRPDYLNRVILMSDGLANRGITDLNRLVALARQKHEQNISTTTMGLGSDFNEDLLMAMADAGGGAFYFIESPEVAPIIFEEELRGLLSVVGQNLVVSVEPSDHVTSVNQLNAYNMHSDGKRISFSLGDVFGDEVKALMLELNIPALHDVGEQQIALLRFEYDEILESGSAHQILELPVTINVAPQAELPAQANPEVRRSVLLLKAAQARRDAVNAADRGDYQSASQVLKQAAEAINDVEAQNAELGEEREALLRQASEMDRGPQAYDQYSRKTMATQAMYTMTDRHESTQFLRTREIERLLKIPPIEKKMGVTPTFVTWRENSFPLDRELIRIGRASQNELVMNAKNVSRFHCQIKRDGDKLVLEDLGSTNGTVVNDEPLKQPHVLSVGDIARIGHEQIIFHDQPINE